jgi:hypothetical protein
MSAKFPARSGFLMLRRLSVEISGFYLQEAMTALGVPLAVK